MWDCLDVFFPLPLFELCKRYAWLDECRVRLLAGGVTACSGFLGCGDDVIWCGWCCNVCVCGGIGDKLTCDTGDVDNYYDDDEAAEADNDDGDRERDDLVLLLWCTRLRARFLVFADRVVFRELCVCLVWCVSELERDRERVWVYGLSDMEEMEDKLRLPWSTIYLKGLVSVSLITDTIYARRFDENGEDFFA